MRKCRARVWAGDDVIWSENAPVTIFRSLVFQRGRSQLFRKRTGLGLQETHFHNNHGFFDAKLRYGGLVGPRKVEG